MIRRAIDGGVVTGGCESASNNTILPRLAVYRLVFVLTRTKSGNSSCFAQQPQTTKTQEMDTRTHHVGQGIDVMCKKSATRTSSVSPSCI